MKQIISALILLGIIFLILSIIFRKKENLRKIFQSLGILIGVVPLLLYAAFNIVVHIQERKMISNYAAHHQSVGNVSLDLFADNTFILKSDSCSAGFVQGEWGFKNISGGELFLKSSSQNMGKVSLQNGQINIKNIPVCLSLISNIDLKKTGKPLVPPIDVEE
ncbi:MAG: hypothetical protein H6607_08650 [Flavobacteriales bacterium]|nr:hypothetical protein [Flavobacteriales bacterium]